MTPKTIEQASPDVRESIERKLRADLDAAAEQHMPVMVVQTAYLSDIVDHMLRLQAENNDLKAADRDHLSAKRGMETRLNAQIEALQAELAEARGELRSLIESIWRAEYQKEAPQWKPLPDLIGMITQMDNMYAGVRSQRDQARWDLAEAREVPGMIVEWLNSQPETLHHDDIATAIEARDWSKP